MISIKQSIKQETVYNIFEVNKRSDHRAVGSELYYFCITPKDRSPIEDFYLEESDLMILENLLKKIKEL